jgi:hypothetical protein
MFDTFAKTVIDYDDLIHQRRSNHKTLIKHLETLKKIEQDVIELKIADDIVESYVFLSRAVDYLYKTASFAKYHENAYRVLPLKCVGRNCTSTTGLLYIFLSQFPRYKLNICFVGSHIFIGFGPKYLTISPLYIEYGDDKTISVQTNDIMRNIKSTIPDANLAIIKLKCGSQRQPLKQLFIILNAMTQWEVVDPSKNYDQVKEQSKINMVYLRYFNFIINTFAPNEPIFTSVVADVDENTYSGILNNSENVSDIPEYIIKKLNITAKRVDYPGMFYYTQKIDGLKLQDPANKLNNKEATYLPPHTISQTPNNKRRPIRTRSTGKSDVASSNNTRRKLKL